MLFRMMVVVTAANAIALGDNQHSVLSLLDELVSCPIETTRQMQSSSASAGVKIYCHPSPIDKNFWERETSVVIIQPVYKGTDDVLVKKPPAQFPADRGSGPIENIGSEATIAPRDIIVPGVTSKSGVIIVPGVTVKSGVIVAPGVTISDISTSLPTKTLSKAATRRTATFPVDKSTSLRNRSIASATPARASDNISPDPDTSPNIADTSTLDTSTSLASTESLSRSNDATLPARSVKAHTITTATKRNTSPTNLSTRSSLRLSTPSTPQLSPKIPSSAVVTPTPTSPSISNSKTPIVISVHVGIGIAVALTILGIIVIILKRRRSRILTPGKRASLPRYVDSRRELDAGIEHLAPQEIDGVEVGGRQEMMTGHNVPEMGSARDAPRELMTSDNVHEKG